MRKWFCSHARKRDKDGWVARGTLQTSRPGPAPQLDSELSRERGPMQKLRKLFSEGDIIPATLRCQTKMQNGVGVRRRAGGKLGRHRA